MRAHFQETQWSYLSEHFSLHRIDHTVACDGAILVSELLQHEPCVSYLDWLGDYIGSPDRRVTASTLAKRYAHTTIVPLLYALSVYNVNLFATLEQLRLEIPSDPALRPRGTRLPRTSLADWQLHAPQGERTVWRDQTLHALFARHVTPLFERLAKSARVSPRILWENAAVRIFPMYEDAYEHALHAGESATAQRIQDDCRALLNACNDHYYGTSYNPFSPYIAAGAAETAEITGSIQLPAKRKTCCLYYRISAEYCRICPLPAG